MSKTVLIIDNDVECSAIIAHRLRRKKFTVVEEAMLGNAMAIIREGDVDLMIVDNRFPGKTAEKFIASVRSQGNFFPVIFVTGQFWREPSIVGEMADRLKIDQVIRKLLDVDELIIGVQDFLGRRETTDQFAVVMGNQEQDGNASEPKEAKPFLQRRRSQRFKPSLEAGH